MASYTVTLTTDQTSFITTVDYDGEIEADDYHIAMIAVSRIYENEGLDLTLRRWDYTVEQLERGAE
jgi:hypothetical protein